MSRLLAILILVVAVPALAQTPPTPAPSPSPSPAPTDPPAPEVEGAKRHFEQGAALFNDGNYSAALADFEQSYRLRPAPFVLYNIGLTQKALFRYTDAITSLQHYLDESPTLAPERRAEATQIIAEMKALLAEVTFKLVPDHATISVDGRPAGTTPVTAPIAIAAGMHKLEVTADGYEPQKREVMVTAGVPLTLTFELKMIPKTGKVRITASVPRAMVSIDGKPMGLAPIELDLDAGGHMVEVTAPKHQVRRDELVIAAGQTRQLDVRLDRIVAAKKSWYTRWYVLTGAAVLVGGTAVCGVAGCFDTQQSPLPGTLAPGAGGVQ